MKQLLVLMLALMSVTAYGQTQRTDFEGVEDFPPDMLLAMGSFECTHGGYPTGLYECSDDSGIHIRDLEAYTCLLTPEMEVMGTAWVNLNANWDAQYTGPVYGNWIVVFSEVCDPSVLENPDDYFAGTYTGKRRLVMEGSDPVWIGKWKLDGWGVGMYEGVQFKSRNTYEMYTALPLPFELTGIGTGPEGSFEAQLIIHGSD
ncbi:MAG: hypothetical protein OQJ84_07550 [Xanthomonadales bacterium]|nr:hypothetical protein [Xanthomonadales bacterium]